jgi:amidohydrolase
MLARVRSRLVSTVLLGLLACRPVAGTSTAPQASGGAPTAEPAPPPATSPTVDRPGQAEAPRPTAPAATAKPRKAVALPGKVEPSPLVAEIDRLAAELEPAVIRYRRDLHQHPELGNREVRTAKVIAAHLRKHGWKVRTGVAHTGIVAVLEGGRPGPVVALRADMDALPLEEQTGLPFASKVTTEWNGNPKTPVMHACGHDLHMAIAMGVAELLPRVREQLPGTVVILFQPAEEGPPAGELGGADVMVAEGALADPAPAVIFGLHVAIEPVGDLLLRSGPMMASSDTLRITVKGKQAHAAYPWRGVDPITVSAQVVLGLQTIVSRQLDATKGASVISIGSIQGGNRGNIIPESVEMVGTVRTFDAPTRTQLRERIDRTARLVAEAAGATATVQIDEGYPVVDNDPALHDLMLPTLRRVAGEGHVREREPVLGSEDFAFYQQEIPGLFFFIGVVPEGQPVETAASTHSSRFVADEKALRLGVRTMANLAVDYLFAAAGR